MGGGVVVVEAVVSRRGKKQKGIAKSCQDMEKARVSKMEFTVQSFVGL